MYAGQTIPKHTMLLVYTGEVISSENCRNRQREDYDRLGLNYVLTLREHTSTGVHIRYCTLLYSYRTL